MQNVKYPEAKIKSINNILLNTMVNNDRKRSNKTNDEINGCIFRSIYCETAGTGNGIGMVSLS